jgi:hypothetical protein
VGDGMIRKLCGALALAMALTIPASAGAKIDDPVAFVRGVYARWNASQPKPKSVFTARLDALAALDDKESHGEVGRGNDFSFWCNCQDGNVKNVTVKGWDVANAASPRKVVDAKFQIEGKKEHLLFYFEKTGAGWKIDDVQSLATDPWTLSVIYKYGWPDGR